MPSPGEQNAEPAMPQPVGGTFQLEAHASGKARINLAGRDLHLHYQHGVRGTRRVETNSTAQECPYPGLAAFGLEQARWFFGREQLTAELVTRLDARLRNGGVQAVVAPSGAGKSSLLHAGLLAKLGDGALPGSSRWPAVVFTPTAQPLHTVAAQIAPLTGTDPAALAEQLVADSQQAEARPRGRLRGVDPGTRLVMVVDQFEELFTLCPDDRHRRTFIELLAQIADPSSGTGPDPQPVGLVVVGIRADFYAACVNYPQLRTALQDSPLVVGPMSDAQLREAILYPAQEVGLEVESGLVELLLRDLGDTVAAGGSQTSGYEAGRLPLLAHALRATWQQRHGNTLTVQGYQTTGGIPRAVATTAEQVFASLDSTGQDAARILFLRLIKIGDGAEDTRRRMARADLLEGLDSRGALPVLDDFTQARLLTQDQDTVEIIHEALMRAWPRLRQWLNEDRAGLLAHQRLTEGADAWARANRNADALYRGTLLADARAVADDSAHPLSRLEREFINASSDAEQRRTRRLRLVITALSTLLTLALIATGMTVWYAQHAHQQQREIEYQRNEALSRKVASEASALRTANPALAAQLSLAAFRLVPTTEARGNLLDTFATPYATRLTSHTDHVFSVAFSPHGNTLATTSGDATARLWDVSAPHHPRELATLKGHSDPVFSVAFSPAGRILATAAADNSVRLWDIANAHQPRELATLSGHTDHVYNVAFSPDGQTLATASVDNTARLWDVSDAHHPRKLATISGHTDTVYAVVFSPVGYTLATASVDGTARLWDISNVHHPRELAMLSGHTDTVYALAFSPDGRTLATASEDTTARLWDVTNAHRPRQIATLDGHDWAIYTVAFSPDGDTLATAGTDNLVRLWDITDAHRPQEMATLEGHTLAIYTVAFSPDGHTLATTSLDKTTRLWDITGPTLTGHADTVYGVAFSPDGHTLATTSRDATTRLWDVNDPHHTQKLATLTEHSVAIYAAAFSPEGHTLATVGGNATARLWDVTNARHPVELAALAGHTGHIYAAEFSPDGRILATASLDSTARLWDLADVRRPGELAVLTGHTAPLTAVTFSADGRILATAGLDNTARLWDLADVRHPQQTATLTGHTSPISAVALSPDRRTLVTASIDNTLRLWGVTDIRHPYQRAMLTGHTAPVSSVAFSPDGRTLATASLDRTARLWDVSDARHPRHTATLSGHTLALNTVAFHPGGRILATSSQDKTTRLWDTDVERVGARICATAYPRITRSEWEQYFPGLAFNPPCS